MAERYGMLIGGRAVETAKELKVLSPFDNSLAGTTFLAGKPELAAALDAAQGAAQALRDYPSYKKAEALQKVVSGIKERSEGLARIIALEAGKPIKDARAEVARAANTFQIALEESKRLGGEVIPLDIFPGSEGRFGIIRRFPVGTVLGITPFNFPLNLVAHKVAPAMACGCPIIVKPASKTPLSAIILGEIIRDAGWPRGGVNVVPCSGADAETLLDDERIKKLTFTGSAAVGWRLKARANRIKTTLELGGNAGVIVHGDADLPLAVQRCVTGAFAYAGQICISIQRIYVERSVYGRFRDAFLERCQALRLGDPLDDTTDVGPMIEQAALTRTEQWVKEAAGQGAKVLLGGNIRGPFFEPTVLTDTKPSMRVCGEEVFAPVVNLTPYDTFEGAVEELNRGIYGLQAGVFTNDSSRIFHAYGALDVGALIVNDIPTFRVDNMPYGGVKMSGFGREGVRYAMDEMTEMRLLAMKP